jgi:hypothetical protein
MSLFSRSKSGSAVARRTFLTLEALEDRLALDADISGTLDVNPPASLVDARNIDGTLYITSHNGYFEVTPGSQTGSVRITPLYQTILQGRFGRLSAGEALEVSGVIQDIDINAGGFNAVYMNGLTFNNLQVHLGDYNHGIDVHLDHVNVLGEVGMEGNLKEVEFRDSSVAGELYMHDTWDGADLIARHSEFHGDVSFEGSDDRSWSNVYGRINVTVSHLTKFWAELDLAGGDSSLFGRVSLRHSDFWGGEVTLESSISSEVIESIEVSGCSFSALFEVSGDSNVALLTLSGNSQFIAVNLDWGDAENGMLTPHQVNLLGCDFWGDVAVTTGMALDEINVTGSTFKNDVSMELNDSNDRIRFEDSTFEADLCLDGGDGDDGYYDLGGNLFTNGIDRDSIDPIADTQTAAGSGLQPGPSDRAGPTVIRSQATRSRLRVTFSEAIDPATFTAADVTVQGLSRWSVLSVRPVPNSNNRSFDVNLRAPATGGYRLTIGPDVRDLAGNRMNQDGDATNGELTADRYVFEDRTGPVLRSATHLYQSLRLTFSEAVDAKSFTLADIVLADTAGKAITPVSLTEVAGSNGREFDLKLKGFPKGGYNLTVGPNMTDLLGNLMNQDGDRTNGEATQDQFVQKFRDSTGPVMQGITGSRTWFGITVAFNEPVDVASFTLADVEIKNHADGKVVPLSAINLVPYSDGKQFDLRFQADPGTYDLALGPKVNDLFGNSMSGAYKASFILDLLPPDNSFLHPEEDMHRWMERVLSALGPIDPGPEAELLHQLMDRYIDGSLPLSQEELSWPVTLPIDSVSPARGSQVLSDLFGDYAIDGNRSLAVQVMSDLLADGLSMQRREQPGRDMAALVR